MSERGSASLWTDVATVMWKEWRELLSPGRRGSGRSGWLSIAITVGIFGIFLPWQMGLDWVQSPMALVYWGWVPLFLVSGVVADAFAGERERHTLETLLASQLPDNAILLGKLLAAVSYGCLLTVAGLLLGALTVTLAFGQGRLLFYPTLVAVGGAVLCVLASGLAACAGVFVSLRAASVRQAAQTLSIATMLLIFVPVYGLQALPASVRAAGLAWMSRQNSTTVLLAVLLVLAALDALLLAAARLRFQRAKLALNV